MKKQKVAEPEPKKAKSKGKGKEAGKTPNNKPEKKDPVKEKIEKIYDQLSVRDDLGNAQISSLILNMLRPSLGDLVENRHAFQVRAIDMIEECLENVTASLKKVTESKQEIISSADTVKGKLDEEVEVLQKSIEQKQSEIDEKTTVLESDENVLSTVKSEKSTAESEYETMKKAWGKDQDSLKVVQEGFENLFKAMVNEAPAQTKQGKKSLAELSNLMKKVNCDISLVQAVPSALQKEPDNRGAFDKMCITQLEQDFTTFIANLEKVLGEFEEKDATSTKLIQECVEKEEVAATKVSETSTALSGLKVELKTLKANKKSKEREIQDHESAVGVAEFEKTDALMEEELFAGIVADFVELKNRTDIIKPEEEPHHAIVGEDVAPVQQDIEMGDAEEVPKEEENVVAPIQEDEVHAPAEEEIVEEEAVEEPVVEEEAVPAVEEVPVVAEEVPIAVEGIEQAAPVVEEAVPLAPAAVVEERVQEAPAPAAPAQVNYQQQQYHYQQQQQQAYYQQGYYPQSGYNNYQGGW